MDAWASVSTFPRAVTDTQILVAFVKTSKFPVDKPKMCMLRCHADIGGILSKRMFSISTILDTTFFKHNLIYLYFIE